MMFFWLIVTVAFIALEAGTVGLVSIWFAVGAAAAMVSAALKVKFYIQVIIFLAVSGVVLAVLRPIARKCLNVHKKPTNADRVIGMICPVKESIDNIQGTGAVTVEGKVWTARSLTGENIPAGEFVRVTAIQGVKLIVEVARAAETAGTGVS